MSSGRTEHVIQLEVAPESLDLEQGFEAGELQISSALSKPLVAAPGSLEYAAAECELQPGARRVLLHLRTDARWDDGSAISSAEMLAGLRAGMAARPGLRNMLGVADEQTRALDTRTVAVEASTPLALLPTILQDLCFTPRPLGTRAMPRYSGAFRLEARTEQELVLTAPDTILKARVVDSADECLRQFRAGQLTMTCPSAFDVARKSEALAEHRPCELDLFGVVVINALRRPDLASAASRFRLREQLGSCSTTPSTRSYCAPMTEPKSRSSPTADADPADILYANHWPNGELVQRLAAAWSDRTNLRPLPVSLSELRRRLARSDFDVALTVVGSQLGRRFTLPLSLAAVAWAGALPGQREYLEAVCAPVIRAPDDDGGLDAMLRGLLDVLPVVPVCQFLGGYVASPSVPRRQLRYGLVYPVEQLRGVPSMQAAQGSSLEEAAP